MPLTRSVKSGDQVLKDVCVELWNMIRARIARGYLSVI
jgi:hypothetical protein